MPLCTKCEKEVNISQPGQYVDILECGHISSKSSIPDLVSKGATPVEAVKIKSHLDKINELPKIDAGELVTRALNTVNQTQEEFFNAENPLICDVIEQNGKDNAVLIFIAIYAHMTKTLFGLNRFRNLYYSQIEQLRKEIEDKAVKELIQDHDFHYDNLKAPAPKRIKTASNKQATEIDKAKQGLSGLTTKDGKPLDIMKVMGSLMWKADKEKDKEKQDYKAGLDKIKESITSKDKDA